MANFNGFVISGCTYSRAIFAPVRRAEMNISYEYLDPETLEPKEDGQLYKVERDEEGNPVLHIAVNGKLDPETGEFIPDPPPPEPEPVPSRSDLLEEENAFLTLELAVTQARLGQSERELAALLLTLVENEVI